MENNNELLTELLKNLITKEQLENAIRSVIDDIFDYRVKETVEDMAEKLAREKADTYINSAIDEVLNNKTYTSDGFYTKEYKNFEELVKEQIKTKVTSSGYDLDYKVRRAVDDRITEICKRVQKESVDTLADKVMEELATDSCITF